MDQLKTGKLIAAVFALFFALALSGCGQSDHAAPEVAEDEIALHIKLDVGEDIGLLLIDYDANGSGGSGGISNADKSLLKRDDQLFFTLPKHAFDNPSDVENLAIQFQIVTEYVEPNYANIYPAEYTIPVGTISLKADYGESYFITISGDKTNGYQAALEE